ncbi:MAG: hypothetical protein NC084_10190 [Bacteroides sp.]|nr:hypothetical protein [Eubacterium sp.]MCM1419171.1 hypothetical protein [Roseburia sp.]MCM1463068.1 hypothetical protein [Bacteroides sp.]
MTGKEIKDLIKSNGLKCWQVAEALGMQDSNFSRRLRKDFDLEAIYAVKEAIAQLKTVAQKNNTKGETL